MGETSEMVERVRNAIDAAWMDWALGEGRQENHGDVPVELLALAAMRAMREPTEAMTRAGVDFALGVSLSGEYRWTDYISDMHRRQIDAALPSPTEPG